MNVKCCSSTHDAVILLTILLGLVSAACPTGGVSVNGLTTISKCNDPQLTIAVNNFIPGSDLVIEQSDVFRIRFFARIEGSVTVKDSTLRGGIKLGEGARNALVSLENIVVQQAAEGVVLQLSRALSVSDTRFHFADCRVLGGADQRLPSHFFHSQQAVERNVSVIVTRMSVEVDPAVATATDIAMFRFRGADEDIGTNVTQMSDILVRIVDSRFVFEVENTASIFESRYGIREGWDVTLENVTFAPTGTKTRTNGDFSHSLLRFRQGISDDLTMRVNACTIIEKFALGSHMTGYVIRFDQDNGHQVNVSLTNSLVNIDNKHLSAFVIDFLGQSITFSSCQWDSCKNFSDVTVLLANNDINLYAGLHAATHMRTGFVSFANLFVQHRNCSIRLDSPSGDGLFVMFQKSNYAENVTFLTQDVVVRSVRSGSVQQYPNGGISCFYWGKMHNIRFAFDNFTISVLGEGGLMNVPMVGSATSLNQSPDVANVTFELRNVEFVANAMLSSAISLNATTAVGMTVTLDNIRGKIEAYASACGVSFLGGCDVTNLDIDITSMTAKVLGSLHTSPLVYVAQGSRIAHSTFLIHDTSLDLEGSYNFFYALSGDSTLKDEFGVDPIRSSSILASIGYVTFTNVSIDIRNVSGTVTGYYYANVVDMLHHSTMNDVRVSVSDSNIEVVCSGPADARWHSGLLRIENSSMVASSFTTQDSSFNVTGSNSGIKMMYLNDSDVSDVRDVTIHILDSTVHGSTASSTSVFEIVSDCQEVGAVLRSSSVYLTSGGTASTIRFNEQLTASDTIADFSFDADGTTFSLSAPHAAMLSAAGNPTATNLNVKVDDFHFDAKPPSGSPSVSSAFVSGLRDTWSGRIAVTEGRYNVMGIGTVGGQHALLSGDLGASTTTPSRLTIVVANVTLGDRQIAASAAVAGGSGASALLGVVVESSCLLWPQKRLVEEAAFQTMVAAGGFRYAPLDLVQQRVTCTESTRTLIPTATRSLEQPRTPTESLEPPPTATHDATSSVSESAMPPLVRCTTSLLELRANGALVGPDTNPLALEEVRGSGVELELKLTNTSGVWWKPLGHLEVEIKCRSMVGDDTPDENECQTLFARSAEGSMHNMSSFSTMTLSYAAVNEVRIDDAVEVSIRLAGDAFGCVGVPDALRERRFVLRGEIRPSIAGMAAAAQVAAVSGALAAAGASAAAVDAQALAVFSLISCSSGGDRYAMKRASFLLSPASIGPEPEGKVVFNLVVLIALLCIQVALLCLVYAYKKYVRKSAVVNVAVIQGDLRFPSMFIVVAGLLQQGTAVLSLRLLFDGRVSFVAVVGAVFALLFPWAVWVYAQRLTRPRFDSSAAESLVFYKYDGVGERWRGWLKRVMRQTVLPVGRWGPALMRKRFGGPVGEVKPLWTQFGSVPALQAAAVCIIASLKTETLTGCLLQYATLTCVFVAVGLSTLWVWPCRSPFMNFARVSSSALLGLILVCSAALAADGRADGWRVVQLVCLVLTSALGTVRMVHGYWLMMVERCFWRAYATKLMWSECRDDPQTEQLFQELVDHQPELNFSIVTAPGSFRQQKDGLDPKVDAQGEKVNDVDFLFSVGEAAVS